ncbi:MAG: ornithine decarboxylase [Streptomycetaceae bacterium]|nr:ornithine decarboxylase [Streptomycetaceae bacterium]
MTTHISLDPAAPRHAFARTSAAFPGVDIRYAVKANPHPAVLRALVECGAGFDVASVREAAACLEAGAAAESLAHGNPVRSAGEIDDAYQLGVRTFTVDDEGQAAVLGRLAPASRVEIRIARDGAPDAKFGCPPGAAADIARAAQRAGLDIAGLSFHIGTQQRDPHAWDTMIACAAQVWRDLATAGATPGLLNLGGGLPSDAYRVPVPQLPAFADAMFAAVAEHFAPRPPRLAIEPGRALVADAATLHTHVKALSTRPDGTRWVYLDAGVWSAGLVDNRFGLVEYHVTAPGHAPDAPSSPVRIGGPTCDAGDLLRVAEPYRLPDALREGDRIAVAGVGAYCLTTAATDFNGLPPVPVRVSHAVAR